jgi:hypothetical protein
LSETVRPGDNRLKGIDPEKLLVLDVDELHPMLEVQYPDLPKRSEELLTNAMAWAQEHKVGSAIVIQDDAQMNRASDLYRQLLSFAGDAGEVEETRKKVKLQPFRATQSIDAWFKNLRERLVGAMGIIDKAQNARAEDVRKAARAELDRQAREAEQEAARLLEQARKVDAEAASAILDRAVQAEEAAERAKTEATGPVTDLTRTRSALGVTTSQSETWTFSVVSMRDLCAAIAKGDVPVTFVQPADGAIKQAIRGRHGMRTVPGLEITPEHKINRRGA